MELLEEQQAYVDQLLEQEKQKLAELQLQVDTLQTKDDEIKTLQNQLFAQKIETTLKENGLLDFADIISVNNENELKATVERLTAIVESKKEIFVPTNKRSTSSYDFAKQNGDSVGMLKSIFGIKN